MVMHYNDTGNPVHDHTVCGKISHMNTTEYHRVTCKSCMKKKQKNDQLKFLEMRFPGMESNEERNFASWAIEAETKGYISNIKYHPETFILSEPLKKLCLVTRKKGTIPKVRHALHKCTYTPDFSFNISWPFPGCGFFLFESIEDEIIIDTKGKFTNRQNDFPVKSKWLYDKYGIYVQKVIPEKLFKKTWNPDFIFS